MSGVTKSGKKNRRKHEKKKEVKMKEKIANSKKQPIIEENDPVLILKEKLLEAKANNDLTLAAKLRQDLWILQDVNAGHDPALEDKTAIEESLERLASDSMLKTNNQKETDTEASHTTESSQPNISHESREIKKLMKKLEDIDKLKVRQQNGDILEKSQLEKLEREESVREELKDCGILFDVISETINTNEKDVEGSVDKHNVKQENNETLGRLQLEKAEKENSDVPLEIVDINEITTKGSHISESPQQGLSGQKEIRKLKKKLEQINKLKSKRDEGENLDASELEKIGKEECILEEIQQLEKMMSFDVAWETENASVMEESVDKLDVEEENSGTVEKSQIEKLEEENNTCEELPLEKMISTDVTSETVDINESRAEEPHTTESSHTAEPFQQNLSMMPLDVTLETVNTNEMDMEASVDKLDMKQENNETPEISQFEKSEKENSICEKLPLEKEVSPDVLLETVDINETTTKVSHTSESSQQALLYQKEIRKLKKKLEQINKLKSKRDKGDHLDASELEKIGKEESISGQILQLEINVVHLTT